MLLRIKCLLIMPFIFFITFAYSEGVYTDTVGWKENALVVFN